MLCANKSKNYKFVTLKKLSSSSPWALLLRYNNGAKKGPILLSVLGNHNLKMHTNVYDSVSKGDINSPPIQRARISISQHHRRGIIVEASIIEASIIEAFIVAHFLFVIWLHLNVWLEVVSNANASIVKR